MKELKEVMMKSERVYHIQISGYVDVGHFEKLTEVYDALIDSQCIRQMSIAQILRMADALNKDGIYQGKVAEDPRITYSITVE